jgi:catalase-peroxidase
MTALVGGMRALGAVSTHAQHGNKIGVLTDRPGTLSNDFFVNLLDMGTKWDVVDESGDEEFIGRDRSSGEEKYRATRTDLVFGSNSQLRAIAEVFAESGGEAKFVETFVSAWKKVMDADRFDLT